MRLARLVSPNASPKTVATRSNSAMATSPQFNPPMISRIAVTMFSGFTVIAPSRDCPVTVRLAEEVVKLLSNVCRVPVVTSSGDDPAVLRIGELARRVAVREDLLRAWERRYGLLKPVRSPGGFRLYSTADEQRVRRMQDHLAQGLAAAQAARAALDDEADHSAVAASIPPAAAAEPTPAGAAARPDALPSGNDRGLAGLAGELRRA